MQPSALTWEAMRPFVPIFETNYVMGLQIRRFGNHKNEARQTWQRVASYLATCCVAWHVACAMLRCIATADHSGAPLGSLKNDERGAASQHCNRFAHWPAATASDAWGMAVSQVLTDRTKKGVDNPIEVAYNFAACTQAMPVPADGRFKCAQP